jgi:hypothetical protein
VGRIGRHRRRPRFHQPDGGIAQRARGIDDVVDQHATAAVDVADDVHHLRDARAFSPLVDDGEVGAEPLGDGARPKHAANVWGHDHQLGAVEPFLDVIDEDRLGVQVVERNIEEALDLTRVQVDGEDPVGAGDGDQVGYQLGRDRRPRTRLAVLSRVAEIGHHRSDAPRRAPFEGVQGDQKLHQVVVGRIRRRLDDEHILAAHVFLNLDEHLHVREPPDTRLRQRQVEVRGYGLGQRRIAVAGENFHLVLRLCL